MINEPVPFPFDVVTREYTLAEETWNTMYPERRKWHEIGAQARHEWMQVFAIYEEVKSKYSPY